jgi:hypothetical protein
MVSCGDSSFVDLVQMFDLFASENLWLRVELKFEYDQRRVFAYFKALSATCVR